MNTIEAEHYLAVTEHALLVLMLVVPIVGNALASILRRTGAVVAAKKLDAWIPIAVGAMAEAKKLGDSLSARGIETQPGDKSVAVIVTPPPPQQPDPVGAQPKDTEAPK